MKEGLQYKIQSIIYKIVFDEDKSITQKVGELSLYFDKYDGKEIAPQILPFTKPCPAEIKDRIYECYKIDAGVNCEVFNYVAKRIADVIIAELEDELINK